MSRQRSRSRVRFAAYDEYEPRGRPQHVPPPPQASRESSYSLSRSRSRSRSLSRTQSQEIAPFRPPQSQEVEPCRPQPTRPSPTRTAVRDHKKEKEWYHKKSLWTGLATVATVAALLPSSTSAKPSMDHGHSSNRTSRPTRRSTPQTGRGTTASDTYQACSRSLVKRARAATDSGIVQDRVYEYGDTARGTIYRETETVQIRSIPAESCLERGLVPRKAW